MQVIDRRSQHDFQPARPRFDAGSQGASDTFTGNRDNPAGRVQQGHLRNHTPVREHRLERNGLQRQSLTTVIAAAATTFPPLVEPGCGDDLSTGAVDAASLKLSTLSIGSSKWQRQRRERHRQIVRDRNTDFKVVDAPRG